MKKNLKKKSTKKIVAATEHLPPPIPTVVVKPEVDEERWGKKGLTLRQKKFVHYYVRDAAGNGVKAATLAGYKTDNINSLKVLACQTLAKPNVQRALTRELGRQFDGKKGIERNIAAIANGSAADCLRPDPNGKIKFDLGGMMEAGSVGLIQKLKFNDDGEVIAIELYSNLKALELAARMAGLLVERKDITSGGKPIKAFLDVDDGDDDTDSTA